MTNPKIRVRVVGPWIVERVLTALAVSGLLAAVIAVGVLLAWS